MLPTCTCLHTDQPTVRLSVRMSGAHAGTGPGPELPDLSHLTEEERSIILAVMERQRKEEEKEQSMLK